MKPKVDPIKKVESCPINDKGIARLVVGSEEDGGRKYPLKTFHDPVISLAIFEEAEEIEDFGGCAESDNPAALKEEFPVAPGVR